MADTLFTSGLLFPIPITAGVPTITSGVDLIKSSIKIILSWPKYTRIFNHIFGSRIFETLEEPNDNVLLGLVEFFIMDAINRWEPRVSLTSIDVNRTSLTSIKVDIFFRIKALSIEDTLSYTFNY